MKDKEKDILEPVVNWTYSSEKQKGKIYVNGIEITDWESWNKVIDSLNDLQQENQQLKDKIDKAIELIKRSAGYKGICTQPETDTFSTLLEILGDKENE